MFETIVVLIGTPFAVLIYSDIFEIPKLYFNKFGKMLMKPFGCGFCLSFWISLISQFLIADNNILISTFISFPVPFVFNYIQNKFQNDEN